MFSKGAEGFFHYGENERWKTVFSHKDLNQYQAKLNGMVPPACAAWVEQGRFGAIPD
jgi:aryl sulfotransferase